VAATAEGGGNLRLWLGSVPLPGHGGDHAATTGPTWVRRRAAASGRAQRLECPAKAPLPEHTRGMDADDVLRTLELEPHPEGGHYRETWSDEACSAIYFLLRTGERSRWHRVRDRVEIWHFYAGSPLRLEVDLEGAGTAAAQDIELGRDLRAGQRPQAVVPAGAWQSARTLGPWTLVGCTVAPPFTFDAFDLAPQ